jgi:hypothetical protein
MGIGWWLWACLVISVVSITAGYALTPLLLEDRRRIGLRTLIGKGTWKFTESWASTLTASAGVLGLVLATEVLPEQTQIPKSTYVLLNLMFAVLVVTATLFYNAIRVPKKIPVTSNILAIRESQDASPKVFHVEYETGTTTENRGFVIVFLAASALVLWAVLGQLVTTWYVLGEINSLPQYVAGIFTTAVPVLGVSAVIYGVASVPWTLYNQAERGITEFILP